MGDIENSKYDGLFTTDKNLIKTVIESSSYSEEIEPNSYERKSLSGVSCCRLSAPDPKVILNINKPLILSSYPKSYTHIVNDEEYDMLVKYINKYSIDKNK